MFLRKGNDNSWIWDYNKKVRIFKNNANKCTYMHHEKGMENNMNFNPKPFEIYKHYKGKEYQVLNLAKDCETLEWVVVYQALYGEHEVYVRKGEDFTAELEEYRQRTSGQKYRFQLKSEIKEQDEALINTEHLEMETEEVESAGSNQETWKDDKSNTILDKFLDADDYEEKLNILIRYKGEITQEDMNAMAISLDLEVNPGELEERLSELKNCLLMLQKFECSRMK